MLAFLFGGASPPNYEDIDKQAKDLFTKNFNFGNVKVNLKSKSSAGAEFGLEAVSEIENGKASGFGEFKNVLSGNDMTISTKWLSDNNIVSEVSLDNRIHQGTKFGFITKFDPKAGKFGGSAQAEYKNDFVYSQVQIPCDDGKPQLVPSIVFSANGWLAGTQFIVDPNSRKIEKPCFKGGYQESGYSAFAMLNEKNELYGSLYQKVSSDIESGIMIQLPYGGNKETNFEYAVACNVGSGNRLQTKVNTKCQIGVALVKSLGNGIVISMSGNLDGKNIKQGAHKIGLGLEVEN